jgi:translation elongation factor EF-4
LIELTPIANFTQNIAWDAIEDLLAQFGLTNIIDLPAIKAFAEEIENTLENPNLLIQDLTGINITAIVEDIISQIPDTNSIENIDISVIGYLPMLDFFGPYAFFPSHCHPG